MKKHWAHLEPYRQTSGQLRTDPGDFYGAFYIAIGKVSLIVIASNGDEDVRWEHVSARARDYRGERVPTWDEMCAIKALFWDDEECVVQYHPPKSEYVNNHPHVLHLWKPIGIELPRPPSLAVGIKT